jgi:imidazolonepropionase-like amidohydrolase
MNDMPQQSIADLMRDNELLERAMRSAIREDRRKHKLLGYPIVIVRDGKIVWVPPEEIDLGEEMNGKNGNATDPAKDHIHPGSPSQS